jgi:protease-4
VVVAQFGDVAASGAYYVALAADRIVAHPTTLTGSIGVIMQSYNIRDLAAKLGITDVTIKSGANKDLLNPFGELTNEQRAMLQGVVDALQDRFVALTAERRNLDESVVRAIADGRVFLAAEALKHGLIDQVGYAENVDVLTASLLETNTVRVIRYEEPRGLMDLFLSQPGRGFNLQNLIDGGEARLLYK